MTRKPTTLIIGFAFGLVVAMVATSALSGCSKAADRTLTIKQYQSTETYDGKFRLDTSALPSDAIETRSETGGPGDPVTEITLNMKYEFEIVVRLASK